MSQPQHHLPVNPWRPRWARSHRKGVCPPTHTHTLLKVKTPTEMRPLKTSGARRRFFCAADRDEGMTKQRHGESLDGGQRIKGGRPNRRAESQFIYVFWRISFTDSDAEKRCSDKTKQNGTKQKELHCVFSWIATHRFAIEQTHTPLRAHTLRWLPYSILLVFR